MTLRFWLLVLTLAPSWPTASGQGWKWVEQGRGSGEEYVSAATVDAAGDLYVVGRFPSAVAFGDVVLESAGGTDIFLAKYASDGALLWARRAGGSGSDSGQDVAVDANGGVYITGRFQDTADFGPVTLTSAGSADVFVVKYGPDGDVVWARSDGWTAGELAYGIAVNSQSHTFVVGYFPGTTSFGSSFLVSEGAHDTFLACYDPDGTLLWVQRVGGPGEDFGGSVAVDAAGDVFIAGGFAETATFGPLTLKSAGGFDTFVAKYTSSGEFSWAQRAGGTESEAVADLAVDAVGRAHITGAFSGASVFGSHALTSVGASDVFVARYERDGAVGWATSSGGFSYDSGRSIALDAAGGVYTSGTFRDTTFFDSVMIGGEGFDDAFVAHYTEGGEFQWAEHGGGPSADFGDAVAVNEAGHVYLAGTFRDTARFGTLTLTSAGSADMYLARLSTGTVGSEGSPGTGGIRFAVSHPWPNPATAVTQVTLTTQRAQHVKVEVYDVLGRRVAALGGRHIASGVTTLHLDTSELAPGVYVIRVRGENAVRNERVTVVG